MANFDNENKPYKSDEIDTDILEEFVSDDRSDALDDEQRVQVLSPTMLVLKRFFRNKLAIAGLIIVIAMFLFSFLGGLISPYGETQDFTKKEEMLKGYASGSYNKEYKFDVKEGFSLSSTARAQFVLALNKKQTSFDAGENSYDIISGSDKFHRIIERSEIASGITIKDNNLNYTLSNETDLPEGLKIALLSALEEQTTEFNYDGIDYEIKTTIRPPNTSLIAITEIALATTNIYDTYKDDMIIDYYFRLNAEKAFLQEGANSFKVGEVTYYFDKTDDGIYEIYADEAKTENSAMVSSFMVTRDPSLQGIFLTMDFKNDFKNAVDAKEEAFISLDYNGNETEFKIHYGNNEFTSRNLQTTLVLDTYHNPSLKHWLGTDRYGFDIMTRLMYGGRVSLIIGFIVITIEIIIGVILGGVAGYFSGWIDNLIMRIVDIFNCIPSLPLIIIIGAIMDQQKIASERRILWLMVIMGLLGWPGIARMVRGQILSLREQEFMIATEATGISVSRRIFKHLVPNVIPQLIVVATMGLGGIILTESTLSFLGLGVKYPLASWGNIINDVTNIYVLQNYWYVWIPAGFLILVTVMGFNFVGDGLRDAFDPKMKR